MNGLNFLKKIKETKAKQKVIVMTAYSTVDSAIDANKIGATYYLTKPFVSLRDVENKVLDNLGL